MVNQRVLSGMRATGRMHIGHYHGVLKNWLQLQHQYDCFFFVADWHALTTHYQETHSIKENVHEMLIDWLAAGLNPKSAHIFTQSQVLENAELYMLLGMMTPLTWLERVPTYKEQLEKHKDRDLETYGFLGYPVLMSADILLYKANYVPVGEDQLPHLELTREIARRFNHLYGRDQDFVSKAEAAIEKLGKGNAKLYRNALKEYQEQGNHEALEIGRALLGSQHNLSVSDNERLYGYLEGAGKIILPEPEALLTPNSKLPGLDGQKMSKSYNNTLALRDEPEVIDSKIKKMQTDPARARRTDPGDPEKCPVWPFHKLYSDDATQAWVQQGCRSASIGCLDCKKPVIESIQNELAPIRERAKEYEKNPSLIKSILAEGCDAAREVARATLTEVRTAIGLND